MKRLICVILVMIFSISMTCSLCAIDTNYTVSYGMTSTYANFKSPFRMTSNNTVDRDIVVNEKFSQMRLWRSTPDTHEGIDFSAAQGTDVYAVYAGTVKVVNENNPDLKFVVVEHTVGTGKVYSVYVHLEKITVEEGDYVTYTSVVGRSGPPDNEVYGYHLHFGLTSNYSDTYSDLIWVPTYNYYRNSSCFNNGKDLDYMYGFSYDAAERTVNISGYFKGDSTQIRESFDTVYMYYKLESSARWVPVTMSSTGTLYEFTYDLNNLNVSVGDSIKLIFVGIVTSEVDDSNGGLHWQYYPAKFKVPTINPNSLLYDPSYLSFTIADVIARSNADEMDFSGFYEVVV